MLGWCSPLCTALSQGEQIIKEPCAGPLLKTVTCHMIWQILWWFYFFCLFSLSCPRAMTSKEDPNFQCLSSKDVLALTEPTSKQYVTSAGVPWSLSGESAGLLKDAVSISSAESCLKRAMDDICQQMWKQLSYRFTTTLMLIQEKHKKWRASSRADLWYWQHLSYELQVVVLSL